MNKYSREFIVEEFLCRYKELPLNHIINYLIETSNCHSKSMGLSNEELVKNGYTWMLYKWKINILKYPKAFEKINIITWTSSFKSLITSREYEIFLGSEKIASATANFLLVDLKTIKPISIPKKIIEIYKIYDVKNFDKIERINEPKDLETVNNFDYKILKRDIDFNKHVNNSIYAELLYEALPTKFSKVKFTDININYTKELKLGDHVYIDVYAKENGLYFFFKNRERNIMYARVLTEYISWKKIFQMVTLLIENL